MSGFPTPIMPTSAIEKAKERALLAIKDTKRPDPQLITYMSIFTITCTGECVQHHFQYTHDISLRSSKAKGDEAADTLEEEGALEIETTYRIKTDIT